MSEINKIIDYIQTNIDILDDYEYEERIIAYNDILNFIKEEVLK
jgi:hypothetical protein